MKAEAPTVHERASSRIAVSSWSLRPLNPHHLLERLQQFNLNAVEVNASQIVNDPENWGDVIDVLRQAGVWVVSGRMDLTGTDRRLFSGADHASLLADFTWFTNRFHAEKIARLADRCSVGLITVRIGSVPSDPEGPEWAKLVDRAGALAEIFAHYGLNLAIDTGQARAADLNRLLEELNIPNVGINFDPAAIVVAKVEDPIHALRVLANRIRQAHIRDAVPGKGPAGQGREVAVGRGVVNWNAFFEIAMGIVPPIQFVIERDPRSGAEDDIAVARDLIASHLVPKYGLRR